MRIAHVDLSPFEPVFAGGKTYVMSVAAQTRLDNAVLRITTDGGLTGTGEVARMPTAERGEVERLESAALAELEGAQLADVPALLDDWRRRPLALRGLCFALDCAWHDMLFQRTGLPLSTLLGGPRSGDVPEILSLSAGSTEATLAAIRADDGVSPVIQIKVGVDALASDLACVEAALATLGRHQRLLADFNGALELEVALAALADVSDERLMWEDPCRRYEDNVTVARALPSSMMVDASLAELSTFARAIADGLEVVCIKPAKFGGLTVARAARDMCVAAGIRIRIDGPWCGQLGAHAALSLATGTPAGHLIGSIDLCQPLDTARDMIARPSPGRVGPAR